MKRSQLDNLISSMGLIIAAVLFAVAGLLFIGQRFVHDQVSSQLSAQKIVFPKKGSEALDSLPADDKAAMENYAGETMETGAQAKVYADNYINQHLKHIGNGKTYAELSSESMANPDDKALAGKVDTVFRGETLRGMLLNAYAFDTMARVAGIGALSAFVAALVMLVLAFLGFGHASTVKTTAKKSRKR